MNVGIGLSPGLCSSTGEKLFMGAKPVFGALKENARFDGMPAMVERRPAAAMVT